MKKILLIFILSVIHIAANGQPYYQITNFSGTASIACTDVTVTSSGTAAPYTLCGSVVPLVPYGIGVDPTGAIVSGAYTWTFAPGVNAVRINVVAIDVGEEVSVTVNGTHMNFNTSPASSALSPCPYSACYGSGGMANVSMSGNLTGVTMFGPSQATIDLTPSTTGMSNITSVTVEDVEYTGGDGVLATIYLEPPICSPCSVFGGAGYTTSAGGTIGSGTLSGNYHLTADLTITGNVTANDAIILIDPGVNIYVKPTASLTLNGCHLFSCNSMWDGITLLTNTGVTSTGKLVLEADPAGNSTLIEDAYTAVTIDGPATPAGGGNILTSTNTIFNRNYTGISISNYNTGPTTYPFEVQNTVFTSRNFSAYNIGSGYPFTWPNTTGPNGLKTSWTSGTGYSPYDEPFNINNPTAYPSGSYPAIGCKVFTGALQIGISLSSVGNNATAVLTGLTYFSGVVIGEPNTIYTPLFGIPSNPEQNLFESLNYGVKGINANVTVHNSAFAHMTVKGFGIYTLMNDGNLYQLTVENSTVVVPPLHTVRSTNLFYNCNYGVYSNNYYYIKGDNASMITEQSLPATSSNYFGYYIVSGAYESVEMNENTITNVANAISMVTTTGSSTGFLGSINVNSNEIYAAIPGTTLTTQYTSYGISLQDGLGSPTIVSPFEGTINTNNNTILDAYRGIYINGYVGTGENPTSSSNNITVVQDPAAGSSSDHSTNWGINHTACMNNAIGSNTVMGANSSATNDNVSAYIAESNTGTVYVQCNSSNATGRGFEFDQANPCYWDFNTMQQHGKGMVLNNSVIGPQYGSFNEWAGPTSSWAGTSHYQTFVITSSPTLSPLYTWNIPTTYWPTNNGGSPPYTSSDLHIGAYLWACHNPCSCSPLTGHGSGGSSSRVVYEHIAQNTVPYSIAYTNPQDWAGQYMTLRSARADSTLTDSSAVLDTFKTRAALSRFQYLTDIEDSLAKHNIGWVTTQLALTPTPLCGTGMDTDATTGVIVKDDHSIDYIIANNKAYYSVYLDYITHALSSADSGQIKTIAGYCPLEYGPVVYKARALYAAVFNELRVWNDSCTGIDTGTYRLAQTTGITSVNNTTGQKYTLYPNPNDGNFILQQAVPNNELVDVEVWDAVGRSIYNKKLLFLDVTSNIRIVNIVSGLYLLQVTDSKGRIFRFKFVKE